jgi:hypothetical protein
MTGEGSEEFESVELMCYLVFGGIGNDIVLNGEFIESEGTSLDVAGNELL